VRRQVHRGGGRSVADANGMRSGAKREELVEACTASGFGPSWAMESTPVRLLLRCPSAR
jgi:hypothetical protein